MAAKHHHPQHASLHGRWLREQIRIAKKTASNKRASDAEHKGALARLTHLHSELTKLTHRPQKTSKKKTKKKK